MSIYDEREENGKSRPKINLNETSGMNDGDELAVTCAEHGEEMRPVGISKRGLPNYYCPHGCKLEAGVGRVTNLLEEKGYGFLETRGDGENVFFHFSNLNGAELVKRGDLLKFRIGFNPVSGKLQAVRVESLNGLRR